ncbi:MAG: hypothetical protein LBO66_07600 [Deltaproteobacteria bacterium]|jgi:hypothetical protein|nr:hypothetical protein [Deltaproteobacteria bacterium]
MVDEIKDELQGTVAPPSLAEIAAQAVYDGALKLNEEGSLGREYLGMSYIGHPCSRNVWFKYRGANAEPIPDVVARKFQAGHNLETRIKRELIKGGCFIYYHQGTLYGFNYRFMGHVDGLITLPGATIPYLLEIKGVNDAGFAKYVTHGVKSNSMYLSQIQVYLGRLQSFIAPLQRQLGNPPGTPINKALFIVENKDTQKIHVETVNYREDLYKRIMARAASILTSRKAPDPLPSDFPNRFSECNICGYKPICAKYELWPKVQDTRCLDCKSFRSVAEINCNRNRTKTVLSRRADAKTEDKTLEVIADCLPMYTVGLNKLRQERRGAVITIEDIWKIIGHIPASKKPWCAQVSRRKPLDDLKGCESYVPADLMDDYFSAL